MPKEQIVMGAGVAVLCMTGLVKNRWCLANTRIGRYLVRWLGEPAATWVHGGLMVCGIAFGIMLATNVIRPVQW